MITVLVKFKISNELNLKTLKEKFNSLFDDVEELERVVIENQISPICLLYTSDAADDW